MIQKFFLALLIFAFIEVDLQASPVDVPCKINIETIEIEEPTDPSETTIFQMLLQSITDATKINKASLLEKGGKTAKIFAFTYDVSGRKITQSTLYKALPVALRQALETENRPLMIRCDSENPIAVFFVSGEEVFSPPPLLTNHIDDGWQPAGSQKQENSEKASE